MGQKTNPISLRLNIDRHVDSCWYPGQFSDYGQLIQSDLNIRNYLKSLFASLGLHTGRINVQMFPKKLHIHYFFHPDPLRASQRRRIANSSQESSSSGLSFLRSVREKQKLSSSSSLTFREALALDRQKMNLPLKKIQKSFSLQEIESPNPEKISEFFKTLSQSSNSKKSGEAGKLFLFKGFSSFKFSQDLFQKIFDPQNLFLKNHDEFHSQKKAEKNRAHQMKLRDFYQSQNQESFVQSQELAQSFFQKSEKISKNLAISENLCRFFIFPQSVFKTEKMFEGESFSKSHEILHEYSQLFHSQKNVIEFLKRIQSEVSLWSRLQTQRSMFWKEKNLKHIEKMIGQSFGSETVLVPMKIQSRTRSAHFLCQTVIQQFQKNFSFRQIYKNLFKDIQADPRVQGIRLVCSGRFGGVEMARVESRKYGQTSLHIFASHIDYAHGHAITSSGLLGVKIWISYRPNNLLSQGVQAPQFSEQWIYPRTFKDKRESQ